MREGEQDALRFRVLLDWSAILIWLAKARVLYSLFSFLYWVALTSLYICTRIAVCLNHFLTIKKKRTMPESKSLSRNIFHYLVNFDLFSFNKGILFLLNHGISTHGIQQWWIFLYSDVTHEVFVGFSILTEPYCYFEGKIFVRNTKNRIQVSSQCVMYVVDTCFVFFRFLYHLRLFISYFFFMQPVLLSCFRLARHVERSGKQWHMRFVNASKLQIMFSKF